MNYIWEDYFSKFNYGTYPKKEDVRPGCEPLKIINEKNIKNSIVLLHGLSDSPHFMEAIGRYFHEELNFNVFIPLLQSHGLKEPNGMAGVSLSEWKENVKYAVEEAHKVGENVSIGGLSTGGALSVFFATTQPENINGGIFLFSAALDLAGDFGDITEIAARSIAAIFVDKYRDFWGESLINDNPYRYSHVDTGGATQLAKLIAEVDKLTEKIGEKSALNQPLFVAHSENDQTADIQGVEELVVKAEPGKSEFFRMGKFFNIPHASVVLKEPVKANNGSPLEPANPYFNEMMLAMKSFTQKHFEIESN